MSCNIWGTSLKWGEIIPNGIKPKGIVCILKEYYCTGTLL